jgi:hypothetical protein
MKAMRKYLFTALLLAAACDATKRDFAVCDLHYSECNKGFTCDLDAGLCVPETDAGPPMGVEAGNEAAPPVDVPPGEVQVADVADAPGVDANSVDMASLVDGQNFDVPEPVDTNVPDTRIPDAPGTCTVDTDCPGGLPYCMGNRCVACKQSSQCNNDAGAPFCSAVNTCVSCAQATGDGGVCSGAAPVCDNGSGRCVECVQNSDCPTAAKAFCVANQCVGCNAPGASAGGSGADAGASDGGGSALGPCTGARPVCATTGTLAGQCVQCVDSTQCSGSKPICDTTNTCVACATDGECQSLPTSSGICMIHQDGRCASTTETIFVKNSSSCSGGSGTAASPYCDTQAAINAVTSSKRVILVKGPATDVITPISSTPSGAQISIVGQSNPTTSAGAAIGIHVTAGDVYIRGLTVAGGSSKVGVQVEAGATIRLDRCIVKNNAGGGLLVQAGASFDVANSVFDNNGPGSVGPVAFGGVYLAGAAPASGAHRFWFSTIVNNQDRGVVCADSSQSLSGMLLYGNVNGGYLNCTMDSTNSKWDSPGAGSDVADPALSTTNPYHLTTSSRCRDFIAATLAHPATDLDGDARPYPTTGKLDCGADEYHP